MIVFPLAKYLIQEAKHPYWPNDVFPTDKNRSYSYMRNKRIQMPKTRMEVAQNFLGPEKHLFIPRLLPERLAASKAFTEGCQDDV